MKVKKNIFNALLPLIFLLSCRESDRIIVFNSKLLEDKTFETEFFLNEKRFLKFNKEFVINENDISKNIQYRIVDGYIVIAIRLMESNHNAIVFKDVSYRNGDMIITVCQQRTSNESIYMAQKIALVVVKCNFEIEKQVNIKLKYCELG